MKQNEETKSPWIYLILSIATILASQLLAYATSDKGTFFLNYVSMFIMLIQLLVFLPCSGIFGNSPTESIYDLTGSMTYVLTLLVLFFHVKKHSTRQAIVKIAILIWSIRLGWFLFSRISKNNGIDHRFTSIKSHPASFLFAWCLQGLWVFTTLLAALLIHQGEDNFEMSWINYIGIFLWVLGFSIEVVADMQKNIFKATQKNKEKWISTGLWSISRHPNYFGEILLWIGIALICIQDISLKKRTAFLFISPAFVAFLLIFISGVPILEEIADKKFGENPEYMAYKRKTPVLVPYLN
ncbi:hypothetical protein GINT2_000506 [Glugoides intestinalis]